MMEDTVTNQTSDIDNIGNKFYDNSDGETTRRPTLPQEGRVMTGVVKKFLEDKGFGFILDSDNNEYFVHFAVIQSKGFKNLARGQHVKFVGKEGPKGLFAEDVKIIS